MINPISYEYSCLPLSGRATLHNSYDLARLGLSVRLPNQRAGLVAGRPSISEFCVVGRVTDVPAAAFRSDGAAATARIAEGRTHGGR